MPTTNYMSLILPIPGASDDVWDDMLNAALTLVDSHNHTTGHGIKVPASGLNINSDLPFNGYNIDFPRAVRLTNLGSVPILASDINTLAAVNDELYFIDGQGNQVQITSGGSLNAAALGAIGGDYGASTALLAFYNATEKFVFTKDTNEAAPIDCGPVIVRDIAASALGITLQSPVGLAGAYSITLPAALPSAGEKKFLQVDDNGVSSFGPTLPGSDAGLVTIDASGDLATLGTVVGINLTLPGNLTLSGDLSITGKITAVTEITLDNAATHGGRINFDGGATSYIGSSADGTTLQIAGFTDASVPVGVVNDLITTGEIYTSFTPVVTTVDGGGTAPSGATTVAGQYYKLGKLVFVQGILIYPAGGGGGSGSNQIQISLPVAANASTLNTVTPIGSLIYGNFGFSTNYILLGGFPDVNNVSLYRLLETGVVGGGEIDELEASNIASSTLLTKELRWAFVYIAA